MTTRAPFSLRNQQRGETPPWQPLTIFFVLLALIFGIVFLSGGGSPEPKLGIDLQGGTRIVLTARTDDGSAPERSQLDQARQIIDQRVNGLGVGGSEVVINGDTLVITVPGDDGNQAKALGQTARLYVRPVITSQAVDKAIQKPASAADKRTPEQLAAAIEQARKARQAPMPKGQSATDGHAQPAAADLTRLQAQLSKLNCDPKANDPLVGHDLPDQFLVACGDKDGMAYLLGPKMIDGRDVDTAGASTGQTGQAVVNVEYKGEGRDVWAKYTASNNGGQTAVVLDTRVVSAAAVNNPDGRSFYQTEISGDFTRSDADYLANALKYGSLPLSFESSDTQTVSATLGFEALRASLIAGLIGLIAVLIYALAYYRMLGFLSVLSLLLAAGIVYGLIVLLGRWIGFTLDLAGIAGLIIGIGMTADSFVVYFERIKDEMREGRSFRSAVPRGWASARRTVWTGNAVSFIASVVIYILAIGEVRGFAFTLGLTTIIDVVIVFLVTHPLVVLASRSKFLSRPSVNGLGAVSDVARRRREAAAAARIEKTEEVAQ